MINYKVRSKLGLAGCFRGLNQSKSRYCD